jgi:hypothetical protein
MSAFLGPIHQIMFERIRLVDERQQDLLDFVREAMSPSQAEALPQLVNLPAGELAELIGQAPIHAWLQSQMEAVMQSEFRLWATLADTPDRLRRVAQRLQAHGRQTGLKLLEERPEIAGDARLILQEVNRILLTSMPCDHVSEVIAASPKAFIERRDLLFHERIWQRAGLDESKALQLQEAWMVGLYSAFDKLRYSRVEMTIGGQRYFDDRVSLQLEEVLNG